MKRLVANNEAIDTLRMVSVLQKIQDRFGKYAEGNFYYAGDDAEVMEWITSADIPDNAFKKDFADAYEKAKSIIERGKALKEEAQAFRSALRETLIKGEKMSDSVSEADVEPDDKFFNFGF